ncbi:low-density lipoprotein receptor-related protein 3-like [Lampetra fluviatilis]
MRAPRNTAGFVFVALSLLCWTDLHASSQPSEVLLTSALRTSSRQLMPWACGSMMEEMSGPSGVIHSPGWPTAYPGSLNCSWFIRAQPGHVITISFTGFEMEGSEGCTADWLMLGPGSRGAHDYRACGSALPPPFISPRDHVWIKFHSDASASGSGFELRYVTSLLQATQCPDDQLRCANGRCVLRTWECNGQDECGDGSDERGCKPNVAQIGGPENAPCGSHWLRNFYGWFSSPRYPHAYPAGANCRWVINTDDARPLVLLFVDLQLAPGSTDTLEVFEGLNSGNDSDAGFGSEVAVKPLVQLTGLKRYDLPVSVQTASGQVVVRFFSDRRSSSARGFNATYRVAGYCPPLQHPCGGGGSDGGCYDDSQRCDGHWDCVDGRDEAGCGQCPQEQFPCAKPSLGSGAGTSCYGRAERCNYQTQCPDGSDERHCLSCQPGTWHCHNDRCIFESWVCDGQDDCGDGSDEKECPLVVPRRVITAATIGGLVCGLLLVIALGCSCKLYTLRSRQYRWFDSPLTRLDAELLCREPPPSYSQLIAQGLVPPVEDFPVHTHGQASVLESLRLAMRTQLGLSVAVGGAHSRHSHRRGRLWRRLRRLLRGSSRSSRSGSSRRHHGAGSSGRGGDSGETDGLGEGGPGSGMAGAGLDSLVSNLTGGAGAGVGNGSRLQLLPSDDDDSDAECQDGAEVRGADAGPPGLSSPLGLLHKQPPTHFVEAANAGTAAAAAAAAAHTATAEDASMFDAARRSRSRPTALCAQAARAPVATNGRAGVDGGRGGSPSGSGGGLGPLSSVARILRARIGSPLSRRRGPPSPGGAAPDAGEAAADVPMLIAMEDCMGGNGSGGGDGDGTRATESGTGSTGGDWVGWGGARPRVSPPTEARRVAGGGGRDAGDTSDDDSLLSC